MTVRSGKLRVYLGMSAGVGKTYSMLADARRDKDRGIDIVIGYLEMHGRQETESLADGMETIPRTSIEYQGRIFEELNVDEIISRQPQVVLVDELAHTNIPGARNKKRYQDVEEILQAGINVRTTLNVQHLESLVGIVKQVSGVYIQETVPDSLLTGNVEIEVVDITPNQLLDRLKEGKVYKGAKAPRALENFFREENLTALRELLLRASADRVESDLLKFRSHTRDTSVWGSKERILVCVAPDAMSTDVVREGYRMASSIKGELIALSVESERYSELSPERRQNSEEALRVARTLGARTITRIGHDVAFEILEVANSENVSQIFIGKPPLPNFFLRRVTLIDKLISQSKDIDIHLVQLAKPKDFELDRQRQNKFSILEDAHSSWADFISSIGILTVLTFLFWLLRDFVENLNFMMAYLLAVSFIATRYNKRIAILSSFLSVLAFDFFFVPPFNTLAVSDFKYAFVFLTMFAVGITISLLTNRVRAHTQLLHYREERTNILYGLSQSISSARNLSEIQQIVKEQLELFLKLKGALSFRVKSLNSVSELFFDETLTIEDQAVASWSFNNSKVAGFGTDTLSAASGYYIPIKFGFETIGVLAIFNNLKPLSNSQSWILESFVDTLSTCIDRLTKEKELRELNSQLDSEKMRSTFLSSISHDLRTPLAAIQGAAGLMAGMGVESISQITNLAETIEDESLRLSSIIRNVLDLTRVKSEGFKINASWVDIEDIIGSAIRRLERLLNGKAVKIEISEELPLMYLDELLVEQLIVNLIENSLKYGPKNSEILIELKVSSGTTNFLELVVSDRIFGMKDQNIEYDINKADDSNLLTQSSYGLGFEICSAVMNAHDGTFQTIKLQDGLIKTICLFPFSSKPPEGPIE